MFPAAFDERFAGLIDQAHSARERLEVDVVHAVINDPKPGVAAAREIGMTDSLLSRADLMVIWAACCCGGRLGRDAVVQLAYVGLRDRGLVIEGSAADGVWDGVWSLRSLDNFAWHFSADPAPAIQRQVLALKVPRLIDLHRRLRDAREYLLHAITMIEEAAFV